MGGEERGWVSIGFLDAEHPNAIGLPDRQSQFCIDTVLY